MCVCLYLCVCVCVCACVSEVTEQDGRPGLAYFEPPEASTIPACVWGRMDVYICDTACAHACMHAHYISKDLVS